VSKVSKVSKANETEKQRTQRIKAEWVAALRSGRYNQGQSQLRYLQEEDGSAKFCCLGVLCDLYAREHDQRGFWPIHTGYKYAPQAVRRWLDPTSFAAFAKANDAGKTFEQIATMIEETDFSA
jgi:hypothetical protein